MKYLKLFENHNYYVDITRDEFNDLVKNSSLWDDIDSTKLQAIFKGYKEFKHLIDDINKIWYIPGKNTYPYDGGKSARIETVSNFKYMTLRIYLIPDEWILVKYEEFYYKKEEEFMVDSKNYKCDRWEGLRELAKKMGFI